MKLGTSMPTRELKLGLFPPACGVEPSGAQEWDQIKTVLDRTGLKLRETTSQARLGVRAEA